MGLDMYWFVEPTNKDKTVALIKGEQTNKEVIGYFREYHALNDYILNEVKDHFKGDGNCEDIVMTEDLLNLIEEWNHSGKANKANRKYLDQIIFTCRKHFREGRKVIYHAWW